MNEHKRAAGALPALLLALLLALFAPTAARGEPYTYTVRIYAGAQGTIDGEPLVTYTEQPYGERITFDIGCVTLHNDSKYYVRGIRESGRDNSTVDAPAILVTGDLDYVVAYGIKGNTVAYTVRYEDAAGNALRPAATYYGNVGDKPVVAFQYIEGYRPQAYNLTRTLVENPAENVFVFVYTPIGAGEAEAGTVPGTPAGSETVQPDSGMAALPGPGTAAADAATAGSGTTGGTTAVGGEARPGNADGDLPGGNEPAPEMPLEPAEIVDLDENAVPLAPGIDTPGFGWDILGGRGLPPFGRIELAGCGIMLLAILIWLFIRKRRKEAEEDE